MKNQIYTIYRKYRNEVSRKEESSTKIINFIKKLVGMRTLYKKQTQNMLKSLKLSDDDQKEVEKPEQQSQTPYNFFCIKNSMTMSEYYSPRDIKYEEIKHFYKNELLGPSLKRMEINKRVAIAQQLWKKPKLTKEEQDREQIKKMLEFHVKSDERETILNFLDPEYRNTILKKGYQFEEDYSRFTQNLQNKLEIYDQNAHKKANYKLKTQNSGVSVQMQSSIRMQQVPQSGKRQSTQPSQVQQNQMNQTSRPSIMTEISTTEFKSMPLSPTNQNVEIKRKKSVVLKNNMNLQQTQSQKRGQKSRQTLTLQLDTIKDIAHPYNHGKHSQTQIQPLSPQVREPTNFDQLLNKMHVSPKIIHKAFAIFPDCQDMKIRVDAFPQTAAKLQNLLQNTSGDIDSRMHTNVTSSPYNKSGFGMESVTKSKKTIDVYLYAQEKKIIGTSNLSSQPDSVNNTQGSNRSQVASASQIVAASSNKLHSILNGLNSKLMKFKKVGNHTTSQFFDKYDQMDQTKTQSDYLQIKQNELDPFSQQPSQRNINSYQNNQIIRQIFDSNSSSQSEFKSQGNKTMYQLDKNLKYKNVANNLTNSTTKYHNQDTSVDQQSQYFSTFHKNRQSLPSILINPKFN